LKTGKCKIEANSIYYSRRESDKQNKISDFYAEGMAGHMIAEERMR